MRLGLKFYVEWNDHDRIAFVSTMNRTYYVATFNYDGKWARWRRGSFDRAERGIRRF